MKKKILLLIMLAACMLIGLMPQSAMAEDGYGWQNLGSAGFSADGVYYTSLYMYDGIPYVAYKDAGNEGKATVMKYEEGSWQNVGSAGFSLGMVQYTSLYVYNGTPYVAYQDRSNSSRATVMKYEEGSWQNVGSAGFSAGSVASPSLYVYDGIPYVAYRDDDNSGKATVMKYEDSNWQNVGSAGFSAGEAQEPSLYMYDGIPYVAYRDNGNSGKATVMKYEDGSWQNVGSAGFSADVANSVSLYIYNGIPYVAYKDAGNEGKATVMKYEEGSWQNVGSAGFSLGMVQYTSLYVYNGTPYVAYQDRSNSSRATVMKYEEGSWQNVGSAGFSAGSVTSPSLYVYDGTPYVAYQDYGNSYKATVMYYGEILQSPPALTADTADNSVDNDIVITFPADPAFAAAITGVGYDGNALNTDQYTVDTADNNKITLHPGVGGNTCLRTPGTADVVVTASGYEDASVSQTITAGAAASMTATTQPEPGAASGDAFASQPIVTLYDQYGNVCSTGASASASVTASAKAGTGSWTIGGTASVTASSGVAAFTDLTCTLTSAGTGAVTFSSGGLSVDSDTFTIPAASDADAVAAAKTALTDGSVDVAYGATQADKTAAVQSYVNGLLAAVPVADGVAATVSYNSGTGKYDVALEKGSVTDSKSLSMTVNVAPDPDIATVAGAKTAAADATYNDLTQAEAPDEAAAKAAVKAVAEAAVGDEIVTVTITDGSYTAATAGTSADPDGTDGSYSFTVTVSKGIQSATTETKTIAITATAHTGVTDVQAVAAAKAALTDGSVDVTYGATQADKTAAVQSYVNGLLSNTADAAGVTATVTYNSGTGQYDVALSKGSETDSKSLSMTVNESADPDIATVAGAKTAAAGATYNNLTQAEAADEAAAKAKAKAVAVNAVNDSSVTVTINTVSYTAATAGTSADPNGTDGSYSFTVTVSKGIQSATTQAKTIAITATAYTGVTDVQAVAAAKNALTNGTVDVTYGATQADKTAAVQSYVDELLDDVSDATGVAATVTYNRGTGQYDVALSKGSIHDSKSLSMTVNVAPDPDIASVAAAKDALVSGEVDVAYGATQAVKTAAVQSYVNGLLEDVSAAAGVTAIVTYNSGTGKYDVALEKGSVSDSKSLSMTVTVAKKGTTVTTLTPGMVSGIANQTYTGSALKPAVTVIDGDNTLTEGTDYTVSYSNNTDAGTATAIIRGKGDYRGTVRETFTINKAGTTVTELPIASDILVVGKLSDSALTGGSGSVDGTFVWTDPDAVVTETGEYGVTFTPAGDNYDSCTCSVPVVVNEQAGDDETGVVYDFSDTDLPGDVSSISLVVSLVAQEEGAENDTNIIIGGLLDDESDATEMVLYDLSLKDQDGNTITDFTGTITVRIPIPEGMSGDLHVYWYDEDSGTLVDMNATQQDGYLYFSTNHFSFYAIAASSDASASVSTDISEPDNGSHTVLIIVLALLGVALCALVIVFVLRMRRKMDTE